MIGIMRLLYHVRPQCLTLSQMTDLSLPQTIDAFKSRSTRHGPCFEGGVYSHLCQAMSVAGTAIEPRDLRFEKKDEAASDRILRCPRPLVLHFGFVILKKCQQRVILVQST